MYVCIYMNIYVCIYTYVVYIYIDICMYMYVCIHTYIYIYLDIILFGSTVAPLRCSPTGGAAHIASRLFQIYM